jgi:hypothetical protein
MAQNTAPVANGKGKTDGRVGHEIVWLPGVAVLFAVELAVYMRGWENRLPSEYRDLFLWSLVLVASAVVCLAAATISRNEVLARYLTPSALTTLVLGVSADVYIATSVLAGANNLPLVAVGIILGGWGLVWSLTDDDAPHEPAGR